MSDRLSGNVSEQLCRFIGETVTIFTESGGLSGSGFTGVVLFVNDCFVRLVTCIGAAPNCPLGSACDSVSGFCGTGSRKCKSEYCGEKIGSVVDIPVDKIVAFVHNAI